MPAFVARNYRSTIADKTVCRYKHVTPNKDEVTGVDEIMRYSKNTLNLNREFNPSKLELNIEHDNNHKENGKKLRIRCYLCDNKTIFYLNELYAQQFLVCIKKQPIFQQQ